MCFLVRGHKGGYVFPCKRSQKWGYVFPSKRSQKGGIRNMYTFIDFISQITAWNQIFCPINKGVSYTNSVSILTMTLKLDYYYYYYYLLQHIVICSYRGIEMYK